MRETTWDVREARATGRRLLAAGPGLITRGPAAPAVWSARGRAAARRAAPPAGDLQRTRRLARGNARELLTAGATARTA